jgi:hypothetical protein
MKPVRGMTKPREKSNSSEQSMGNSLFKQPCRLYFPNAFLYVLHKFNFIFGGLTIFTH